MIKPEIVDSFLYNEHEREKIASFIYFISDGEFVKIGSAYDPDKRCADLQVGNAKELKLLLTIPVKFIHGGNAGFVDRTIKTERFLQNTFASHRIRGEWFDILNDIDVNEWIEHFGKTANKWKKSCREEKSV